jgi:ABC-type sugar transport system ATPase subunit
MTLLAMSRISKRFDGVEALRDVSLEIASAEIHALVGENGAGKSTLMKVLAGVYAADEGSILLNHRPIRPRDYHEAVQAGISMIFQEPSLFDSLTVVENLFLDKLPRHWSGLLSYRKLFAQADSLLGRLEFKLTPGSPVRALTVGERQLVEIARAMVTGAKLVIMDEPTASLNAQESENLFRLIRRLKDTGVSVVYISHRLEEVMQLADRLTVLRDGEVVGTWRAGEINQNEVIHKMVGRSVDLARHGRKSDTENRPIALEVESLSVRGRLAEVSFSLKTGEILGVAGLRGSGQQVLVRALLGLEADYEGTIRVAGNTHRMKSPQQALALGLAYVTDDRKSEGLLPEMNASYNGTLGSISKITRNGFLQPRLERQAGDRQARELAIRAKSPLTPVKHFSGGNQQKVMLARALEQTPRVLILNEPTCGIDVGAKEEIYRLILQFAAGGMSILLISSDLAELMALSDRILVINRKRPGQMIPAELATDAAVIEAAVT